MITFPPALAGRQTALYVPIHFGSIRFSSIWVRLLLAPRFAIYNSSNPCIFRLPGMALSPRVRSRLIASLEPRRFKIWWRRCGRCIRNQCRPKRTSTKTRSRDHRPRQGARVRFLNPSVHSSLTHCHSMAHVGPIYPPQPLRFPRMPPLPYTSHK